jgi:hypothetical protein
VPDALVRTELVYQRVQQTKRRVSGHLSAGDIESALVDIRKPRPTYSSRVRAAQGPRPTSRAGGGGLRYLAEQAGMARRAARRNSLPPGPRQVDQARPCPAHVRGRPRRDHHGSSTMTADRQCRSTRRAA